MSDQGIHVFVPSMDGEYVPVKFTSPEKDLKESEVLIFLDEEDRQIFIWTGISSSVRKRFISSQIARQMRLERGLTHRISTEDQGNETIKFKSFIDSLKGRKIEATSLLEVSPPAISTDLPERKPKEVITHPTTLKQVATVKQKTLAEAKQVPEPPQPPASTTEKLLEVQVKSKEDEILYFSKEENASVPETKAKMIFKAVDYNLVLTALHISTAATEGRIAFYSLPKKSKTTACKTKNPIFAIYLQEGAPVIELDDLEIPIPAGNSIYFTCPAKTFIGINFES